MAKKRKTAHSPRLHLIDPVKLADVEEMSKKLEALSKSQRIYIAGAIAMASISSEAKKEGA